MFVKLATEKYDRRPAFFVPPGASFIDFRRREYNTAVDVASFSRQAPPPVGGFILCFISRRTARYNSDV